MMLNNQPHMHLNLFQRKNNSKKAEATSYLIGNKITNKITKFSKSHHRALQRQLKEKQKCQEKDIYLLKKDRKLLMN